MIRLQEDALHIKSVLQVGLVLAVLSAVTAVTEVCVTESLEPAHVLSAGPANTVIKSVLMAALGLTALFSVPVRITAHVTE